MPLSLPDPWPLAAFPKFDLDRSGQRATRTRGGAPVVAELSEPLWLMQLSTHGLLEPSEYLVLAAWFDQLEGSLFAFWGYDLRRKWPGAYPGGSWPTDIGGSGSAFDGECSLADVSSDGLTIDLEGLPSRFDFLAGDYVQINLGGGSQALHRVSVAERASLEGEVSLLVQPRVRPGWVADDVVSLKKPSAKMHLVPDSYSVSPEGRFASISFSAMQVLE